MYVCVVGMGEVGRYVTQVLQSEQHDVVAIDTDTQAQEQLAHSDAKVTRKHYRRKGTVVQPAKGFFGNEK